MADYREFEEKSAEPRHGTKVTFGKFSLDEKGDLQWASRTAIR